jgi:hypothetical protein
MFDIPVVVPDSANTLELSRLYIYKVLQSLGHELDMEIAPDVLPEDEALSDDGIGAEDGE